MAVFKQGLDAEFRCEIRGRPQGQTQWDCPIYTAEKARSVPLESADKAVQNVEQVKVGLRLAVEELALSCKLTFQNLVQ